MVFVMTVVFGIDVSSTTSEVAIVDETVKVWQGKIDNDWFGFQELLKKLKDYSQPQIVFEATGVYSKRLNRFLDEHGYRYTMLNPLLAKKQMDGLRNRKTDENDALHLAETQFSFKRRLTYYQQPVYHNLMDLSRFYEEINSDIVREKNRLHRSLQFTFPELEQIIGKPTGKLYWQLVQDYPHPDLLDNLSSDEIAEHLVKINQRLSLPKAKQIASKLLQLGQRSYPAVPEESPMLDQARYHATRIAELDGLKAKIIEQMVKLAKPLPEFVILLSIPGFAEKTVVRLIAELGDIRRFGSSSKLNAFVGIDLRHYESGKYVASDHISKRGNHIARAILYRSIANIASVARSEPNHINDFYQRRKKQLPQVNGKVVGTKKVAVAAMGRLLRTIYHLVTTNQMYKYGV
jgi:transposase